MKTSTPQAWPASDPSPGLQGAKVRVEYFLEVGGAFLSYRLLDEAADRLPGVWAVTCRLAIPPLVILGWRFCSGSPWKIRDLGIARPLAGGWLEGLWLLAFQTSLLLGVFLAVARVRFYGLLDFLVDARSRLNGYPADYAPFVLALSLFSLIHFAWGGELLSRGLAQGLGTIRINAAAGAVSSWLAFGGAAASLALRLSYPAFPTAFLWGLLALSPGPVCEAFYFRRQSILPLVAARAAGTTLALAGASFFLYWYPERSFSAALPLAWISFLSLLLISSVWARRLYPLWRTTAAMLRIGIVRGAPLGMSLAAIVVAEGYIGKASTRLQLCAVILILVFWLRTRRGASARTGTTASESAAR